MKFPWNFHEISSSNTLARDNIMTSWHPHGIPRHLAISPSRIRGPTWLRLLHCTPSLLAIPLFWNVKMWKINEKNDGTMMERWISMMLSTFTNISMIFHVWYTPSPTVTPKISGSAPSICQPGIKSNLRGTIATFMTHEEDLSKWIFCLKKKLGGFKKNKRNNGW